MKNPLALGLTLLGCLAMAVATFLPLYESSRFARIQENTLIQHGGWMLIFVAGVIAVAAYRYAQGLTDSIFVPSGLSVLAGILLFFTVNDQSDRTLYPIGLDGNPIEDAPVTVAALGVGVYLAAAGIAVALVGSLMLWQARRALVADGGAAGSELVGGDQSEDDASDQELPDDR